MNKAWLQNLIRYTATARYVALPVGLCCIVAITVPGMPFAELRWLDFLLWCCLGFFTFEWILHLWTWADSAPPRSSWLTAEQFVYAMAVLPVPLAYLFDVPSGTAWLLGSLWLLKVPAAASGFSLLHRVFVLESKPLASVVIVFLFVLFISAVTMHVIERDAQPTAFGTLPSALYWAVTTLSTSGYGDVVPVTALGRIIAGIVMICGLAVFGLWTGILATGFANETRRRDFVRTWQFVARVPFFKPLDPASIIEIARMLRAQDVAERTVIIRKGRAGDCMYFIASGQVEIVGTNPAVRLDEGAFFGELAILGDGIRTATVVATVPTTLLILELTDYRIFAAQHPVLAQAVEEEGARRLAERRGLSLKKDETPVGGDLASKEVAPTELR